jgi:hypothetical protein
MNIDACWYTPNPQHHSRFHVTKFNRFMVDQPPCNASQIEETSLFSSIIRSRQNLVSVWGWSDPEHAYTNATTHAGACECFNFCISISVFLCLLCNASLCLPLCIAVFISLVRRWCGVLHVFHVEFGILGGGGWCDAANS